MSEAREAVFASIREALGRSRGIAASPADPLPGPSPGAPSGIDEPAARVDRFQQLVAGLGANVHAVEDEAAAAKVLATIASEVGAREVALSDAPIVHRLAQGLAGATTFDGSNDRERLLECDMGVTAAQLGIAETGTLVLLSTSERHRLVSLVPPVHVAIVRAEDVVATLGDALRIVHGSATPPAVSLITGPSRTADIELTLVVGVHGPRELHVIVVG